MQITIDAKIFKALAKMPFSADVTRTCLMGVRFDPCVGGGAIVATDGYMQAVIGLSGIECAEPFTLSSNFIKRALKTVKLRKRSDAAVTLTTDGRAVTAEFEGETTTDKFAVLEEDFPNYRQVCPAPKTLFGLEPGQVQGYNPALVGRAMGLVDALPPVTTINIAHWMPAANQTAPSVLISRHNSYLHGDFTLAQILMPVRNDGAPREDYAKALEFLKQSEGA